MEQIGKSKIINREELNGVGDLRVKAIKAAQSAEQSIKEARIAELEYRNAVQQLYLSNDIPIKAKINWESGEILYPDVEKIQETKTTNITKEETSTEVVEPVIKNKKSTKKESKIMFPNIFYDLSKLVDVRNHIQTVVNDRGVTDKNDVNTLHKIRIQLDKKFIEMVKEINVDDLDKEQNIQYPVAIEDPSEIPTVFPITKFKIFPKELEDTKTVSEKPIIDIKQEEEDIANRIKEEKIKLKSKKNKTEKK